MGQMVLVILYLLGTPGVILLRLSCLACASGVNRVQFHSSIWTKSERKQALLELFKWLRSLGAHFSLAASNSF